MSEKYKNINYLGYGDLFWIMISTFKSELIMRIFSFLSITSVPLVVYLFGQKFNTNKNTKLLIVLLWLTFPMAWWYGKLISPDVYALGISFWGLYLAYKPKNKYLEFFGLTLMGIAVGLKLSFIVVPFFYFLLVFLYTFNKNESWIFSLKKNINIITALRYLYFLLGFLLATPSILYTPDLWLENIIKFSNPNYELIQFQKIFSHKIYFFWEAYYSLSLSCFSLCIPALVVVGYLLFKSKADKKIVIAFLLSIFLTYFLVIKASTYFSWYWFPLIALIPFLFYGLRIKKSVLLLIVSLNLIFTLPFIATNLYIKGVGIYNFNHYSDIETFFISKIQNKNVEKLVAIDPRPSGSSIITINDHLLNGKKFKIPMLVIVSKGMLFPTQVRHDNILYVIQDIFSDVVGINFNNTLLEWSKKTNSQYIYLGEYKNCFAYILNSELN